MKAFETMHMFRDFLLSVGCNVSDPVGYTNMKRGEDGTGIIITEQGWHLLVEVPGRNGFAKILAFVYDHENHKNEELLDIKVRDSVLEDEFDSRIHFHKK